MIHGTELDKTHLKNKMEENICVPDITGMYFPMALQFIASKGLQIGDIKFDDGKDIFTVIGQSISPGTTVPVGTSINVKISSSHPLAYLPSVFQSNTLLKKYLWIFQHLLNSIYVKLDNIEQYFNPLQAPEAFYKWLGSWFSVNVNYAISEEKMRSLIKNIVRIYQWRGTSRGLAEYLEIMTDVKPHIIENYKPLNEYILKGENLINSRVLERSTSPYYFTVVFPVEADYFSLDAIRKINQIIQSEKPAHADFYLDFVPREKKEKEEPVMILGESFIE
ncbi:MAG: PASTA domain-containing protein [Spirochaetales bacterium]|nr:PASTA domain-containing protein [Spirochaetales bacterium]